MQAARLETRTKESNIYASVRVSNPRRVMKVNGGKNPVQGCIIDRSGCLRMDLSKSIAVGTRKMVNYA